MHIAEMKAYAWLTKVAKGEAEMSSPMRKQVMDQIEASLVRQMATPPRDRSKVSMSGMGKAYCQLWYAKNKPETAAPKSPAFMIRMVIGDITEAVVKGVLRSSGVEYGDAANVKLTLPSGRAINGEYDMDMDDAIDDVKSASPYSYINKFDTAASLKKSDDFGYVAQLCGYAKAAVKKVGGWWVVNKSTGDFKYVESEVSDADADQVLQEVDDKLDELDANVFRRCFNPVPETYRKVPSGNKKLAFSCEWCDYKADCWPTLEVRESLVSQAKSKPLVHYVEIAGEK